MNQDTKKRIALITGANKGIGLEIARSLAGQGLTVLVGARNPQLGEQAAEELRDEGLDARFLMLDVTKSALIAEAAEWIESQFGRLDVLVNNAGIADLAKDGPPSVADLDAIRRTYETNVFGAITVTQAMLPLLRKSSSARIVNVSSGLGSLTQNADPNWEHASVNPLAYNSSKAALNMFTIQLAKELRAEGIKVNAADPGYTKTDLNANRGTQTVPEGAAEAIRLALLDDDGATGGYTNSAGTVPW